MLTEQQKAEIKADFLEWSGGFLPDCHNHVMEYVDSVMSSDLNDVESDVIAYLYEIGNFNGDVDSRR